MPTTQTTEPITATVNAFGQTLRGEFGEDALRVRYQRQSYQFTGDPLNLDWVVARQLPIRFRVYLPIDKHNRVQVGWSWPRLTERTPTIVRLWDLIGGWERDWQFMANAYNVSASFQLKDDDGVREIGKLTIECRAIVERIEQLDPMSHLCGVVGGNGVVAVGMVSVGDAVRRFVEYR
jgi:hypothetical protein